jgi:acyl-coenzyme A thioesterase PaaI-like protein
MSIDERVVIKKPEGYLCFACGTANPIGLNLEFYVTGDKVCSEITLGKYHVGWADITHGGIISTLLDEVMSWTILYFKRIFFVTRKMEIKYIKPVAKGIPLIVSGSLLSTWKNEKVIMVKGELRDKNNNLYAKSKGEFIRIDKEDIAPEFEESKEEIFALIDGLPPLKTENSNQESAVFAEASPRQGSLKSEVRGYCILCRGGPLCPPVFQIV